MKQIYDDFLGGLKMAKRLYNLNKNLYSYIVGCCGKIRYIVTSDVFDADSFISCFDYRLYRFIFIRTETDLYIMMRSEIRLYEQSHYTYEPKIIQIRREAL